MIYFTVLVMLFILGVLSLIKKSNLFSPSILFPLVIVTTLLPSLLLPSVFYTPSVYSVLYIFICTTSFSFFSFLFEQINIKSKLSCNVLSFNMSGYYFIAFVTFILCFLMLNEFLNKIAGFANFGAYAEYYRAASTSGEDDLKDSVNYLVRNADMLALPLSVIGLYIWSTRRVSSIFKITVVIFILFSLTLPIISVARSGAIRACIVLLGVFVIFFRFRLKFAILVLSFVVALYVGAGFMFGYGSGGYSSFSESIGYFLVSFIRYLSGGYYTFDSYLLGKVDIFFRFAFVDSILGKIDTTLTLAGMGGKCIVCYPENHAEFVQVGPAENFVSNVYTVFGVVFSNLGWLGVFYFSLCGAIMGSLYKAMKSGRVFFAIVYSFLLPGVVLASFSEYFFAQIPLLIRFILLYMILFKLSAHKNKLEGF
ncbi:O65 family O-antigen polymerase [Escherichia coli]